MDLHWLRILVVVACAPAALVAGSCGSKTPTQPSPNNPGPTIPGVAAPTLDSPASDAQLTTLRPTLTVRNGSSGAAGTRTYDFQISDRSDFGAASGSTSAYYAAALTRTGVAEGTSTTAFAVDQDLQPATRFYWRSRWVQGTTIGEWSATSTFRTEIVGYNRPGELYDPLVNGATVAEARINRTTFVANKGIRIDETDSHVRYRLAQAIASGEFSLDVEGISNMPFSQSGNTGKLKILSMDDNSGNHYTSDYLMNVQYRGFSGNPDHAISFKMLLGEDVEERKLEPNLGERSAGVRHLNAGNTYYWKATWSNGIQVVVQDGGPGGVNGSGSGRGGNTIYDFGKSSGFIYQPNPQFAYLGVNNSTEDTGSWPATYRNVWIGNKARPTSLGSAMTPQ